MREIIFEDSGPRLVFSGSGQLKQLRTGTDSFAEHNDACELLARKVCQGFNASYALTDMYRVTRGRRFEFITLPVGDDGTAEAVFGVNQPGGHMFTPSEPRPVSDPSFLKYSLSNFHGDVAAALGWGNFAIRVRGADKVAALAQFHAAVLAGDVVVVPSTNSHFNSHGVALVNLKELTAEERSLLEKDRDLFLKTSFSA
jgi:hypothetical protein